MKNFAYTDVARSYKKTHKPCRSTCKPPAPLGFIFQTKRRKTQESALQSLVPLHGAGKRVAERAEREAAAPSIRRMEASAVLSWAVVLKRGASKGAWG